MEEKNEVRIDNAPDNVDFSKIKKKVKKNPWIVSTVVFGVVAIILLYMSFNGGLTGAFVGVDSLSGDDAGNKLAEFLNGRTGGGVEYLSYEDKGSLYEVTVNYEGQEIPVFITKDGGYFVQGAVPLVEEEGQTPQPAQQQPPQEIPKSDKPEVELFIMSHCPYGTQAEKGMIPVFELLGDKIDGKIKFVNYAMHAEKEVMEQLRQYCIQEEQSDKFLDYLKCFLGSEGSEENAETCLEETGINKAKLKSCETRVDKEFDITKNLQDKSTWSGGSFPPFLIDDAKNQEYGVRGSPTLIINGEQVSSGRDSASYLSAVCNAFNEAPEECDEEVSSASPSPGFGYAVAPAGSADQAQCG